MDRIRCLLAYLVALMGILGMPPAFAGEFVSEDWQFQVTPYGWALAADGNTTVKGVKSDLDLSFKDIVEELNYGVMLEGEARKGRLGFAANVLYADLGDAEHVSGIKIKPDIDLVWASAVGYYRLGPWDLDSEAGNESPQLVVDPYAGIRYTYLEVDLDFSNGVDLSVSGDEHWVDPILGLRTIWQLSPKWSVVTLGDIGGFGAGSDFAWQATGLVGYRFGLFDEDDATVAAGYRALDQDYSTGSGSNKFEWDVTLHGPIFALGVRF